MMKGFTIQQQQQQQVLAEENMSNLTSASGDQASASSSFASPPPPPIAPPPPKKKRNLPGNPDPEAEVVALSPRTLMATNRFVCEVCGKGFQRDQNLQLHRRGHNLPWKLKQRPKEAPPRRKVYVCPDAGCVHHHPSRALGDLTGIKKHFSRKHGEKKWKCDKCSKKYAVHSDWKAHSKICGTREYRCDCGTLFSRRDSFITHRAFCDALAEESARAASGGGHHQYAPLPPLPVLDASVLQELALKREQQQQQQQQQLVPAPWQSIEQEYSAAMAQPAASFGFSPAPSAHMSATALLQKAAQMGATLSRPPSQGQMAGHSVPTATAPTSSSCGGAGFGLGLGSSSQEVAMAPPPPGYGYGHGDGNAGGGGGDGLTRDFLGLRAFSHGDILSMAGFDACMAASSASYEQAQVQNRKPWHG